MPVSAKIANDVMRIVHYTLGALALQFNEFVTQVWFAEFSRSILEMLGPCATKLNATEVLFILRTTLQGCTYLFDNKLQFLTMDGCVSKFTKKDVEQALKTQPTFG